MAKTKLLNPDYFKRVLQKEVLRGHEWFACTSYRVGVEINHKRRNASERIELKPGYSVGVLNNYKGWSVPGKLYCAKCWCVLVGIPKVIDLTNWCPKCEQKLYDDTPERLDDYGYEIYRDRVDRFSAIASLTFRQWVKGIEHLWKNGVAEPGFHKDHILSVREAFELDLPESVASSPCNIQVLEIAMNYAKGRKSEQRREELEEAHDKFLTQNAQWLQLLQEADDQEPTFTIADYVNADGTIKNPRKGGVRSAQANSNPDCSPTPGEKQAVIPVKSSGTK